MTDDETKKGKSISFLYLTRENSVLISCPSHICSALFSVVEKVDIDESPAGRGKEFLKRLSRGSLEYELLMNIALYRPFEHVENLAVEITLSLIHLIPKWPPFKYSFVFIQISP